MTVQFTLNGEQVVAADGTASLLDVLRDQFRLHSVKDGCSPQGQCGCCTVLVDGAPRVSCVTPVRRIEGRSIVTVEGLPDDDRAAWGEAFCTTGASQCGFCTPGIVLRLEGLRAKTGDGDASEHSVDQALAAHLCRCTGWRTISEAYVEFASPSPATVARSFPDASRRAEIEGGVAQRVDPAVALGDGGFADDLAPVDALVALADGHGGWVVGETVAEARALAGKVQGRRTTVEAAPPLEIPPGEWDLTLETSWIEPAYLETDASWCRPGGEPASPLANGGAFGAKAASPAPAIARALADEHGRPVRVLLSREDTVRLGPKRPPIAAGVRADGTGTIRVVRTPGLAEAIAAVAPGFTVEEVDVPGPPTSSSLRAAGWAEAAVLLAVATAETDDAVAITAPNGARAEVRVGADGTLRVRVHAGDPLDEVVLRSYSIGAAHMALGWVTSEALAVDDAGAIHDLTIRSFGIRRASEMPHVEVEIVAGPPPGRADDAPINGSDAVFAAVAAAVWIRQGRPPAWPTRLPWPVAATTEPRSTP